MILFLHGPDTFRSRQYLHESIAKFKIQRDPQGYNVIFVDGKKSEPGKVVTEIMSAPFLAERRMIIVENILASSDKELLGELIDRVKTKKFPESNVIVFWQGEPLSKVKEAKELEALLAKEKYAQEFSLLKGVDLVKWTEKEIKVRGGQIEPVALEFLCQNVAGDMWRLNSLIDQLVAYTSPSVIPTDEINLGVEESLNSSERDSSTSTPPSLRITNGRDVHPMTITDVQLFLTEKVDDNVFNMVEAVVQGNKKQATRLLSEQRRLGEEGGKIFGLLVWQFRILVEMADLLEREPHVTSNAIAKKLNIHPFVAKKNLAAARRLSLARLYSIYRRLLDIDIKTKTGVVPQPLLLDMFVFAV